MKKLKSPKEGIEAVGEFKTVSSDLLLPSGCDVLNLCCSGSVKGWAKPGVIVNVPGDSNSGKTVLALTAQAATFYKYGNIFKYDFIDYERALGIDIKKMFGEPFAKALNYIAPKPGKDSTIERFTKLVKALIYNKGKPIPQTLDPKKPLKGEPHFIVCDSWDNLSCFPELIALAKEENAPDDDDKSSIGMQRAKTASQRLGKIQLYLADTDSFLIINSQVRMKPLKGMVFADPRSRNGGNALSYYSFIELWLTANENIGKDKKRPIGVVSQAKVKRSKMTGKKRSVRIPILNDYGVDNTRASIMFLADEGVFKVEGKEKPIYTLTGLPIADSTGETTEEFTGKMLACIEAIEADANYERMLRKLVVSTWRDIEERLRNEAVGGRRPKFGG